MPIKVTKGLGKSGAFILNAGIRVSRRELHVLALISGGATIGEAAKRLRVNTQTISNHIHNVVKKLQAKSQIHALTLALENGIVEIEKKKRLIRKGAEDYLLCMFCGRAFEWKEVVEEKHEPFTVNHVRYEPSPSLKCPHCNGFALEAWDWEDFRKEHPECPEIPEKDAVYPVYGFIEEPA